MSRAPWIDEVAERSVAEMAEAVALERVKGNSWACPACQARTRHASRQDRRGAIGQTRGGRGWACHTCGAKGDALDLAAYVVYSKRLAELEQEQRRELRERLTGMGLCTGRTSYQQAPIRAQRPVVELPPEPEGPSPEEVAKLWSWCGLPTNDRAVVEYSATRGWGKGLEQLQYCDLMRVTPPRTWLGWPAWWPRGRARCWRMVTRVWSPKGELLGLHGRAVCPPPLNAQGEPLPKAMGHKMRGPGWMMSSEVMRGVKCGVLGQAVVVEGVADFWAAAGLPGWPPVLGGVSGSFRSLGELPWMAGAQIILLVHDDKAGDLYAEQAAQSLAGLPVTLMRKRLGATHE